MTPTFTEKVVPVIVKMGIGSLVTAKGIFTASDIEENSTGYNWFMDKAFDGDRESYEVFEECIDGLCEIFITCGGMMPISPSSLLRLGNDIQDTDGHEHSGRTGGGKGNTAGVPSIDINDKKGGRVQQVLTCPFNNIFRRMPIQEILMGRKETRQEPINPRSVLTKALKMA